MAQLGDALQYKSEKSRVRFPMGSLGFFIDLTLRSHYGPAVDSALNDMSTTVTSWEVKAAGA